MSSLASRPSDPAACQLALIRTEADLITQFFLIFILGALFGKLIEARGSVESMAKYMTENSGLSVPFKPLCWRARVAYDGVRLFEAFFVLAPMGHALFKAASFAAGLGRSPPW